MLQEYAVDPTLLSRWSDFRYFVSQFGFDRGRLIARYPSKWKKLVYEALGECGNVERARIEEALRRIDDRMISRPADTWRPGRTWLENAEDEDEKRAFWAIIARSNPRSHRSVIIGDDIHDVLDWDELPGDQAVRLWKAHRSQIIKRSAKEMADAVDKFLKHADRILFVDQHFGPENRRHQVPFQEFMLRIEDRANGNWPSKLEVHCAKKADSRFFQLECEKKLAGSVPLGLKVQFFRWGSQDLHNRFVLTELGGVAYLEGLDEFTGSGRQEDVVVLLDIDVAIQLMDQFNDPSPRFSLQDKHEICGTKPAKSA